jgi:predicted anti-sigma-YlaC factor YlaD
VGLGTYGGELTAFHAESPSDDGHVQTLLGVYLLGGMSAGDEAAVRAHLAVCKQCRDEHDYLAVVPRWLDLVKRPAADDAAEGHRSSPR